MRKHFLFLIVTLIGLNCKSQSSQLFKKRIVELGVSKLDSSLIYLNSWKVQLPNPNLNLDFQIQAALLYKRMGDFPREKNAWLNVLKLESDSSKLQEHKNLLGLALLNLGQIDSSYTVYEECLHFAKKKSNKLAIAAALIGLGNAQQNKGDNSSALDNYLKAAKIYKNTNDHIKLAQVYSNIGLSYRDLREAEKSMRYRQLSFQYAQKSRDEMEIHFAKMNLGSSHRELGQLDSASFYLKSAMAYFEANFNPRVLVGIYNELGIVYSEKKEHQKAYLTYEKALKIIRNGGYTFALPGTLANFGTVAFYTGNHNEGLKACKEALPYAKEMGYLEGELTVCSCLYNNFKALGQADSALAYFERVQEIEDTLGNNEIQKAVLEKELEMKHLAETELIERKNELKRQKNQRAVAAREKEQKNWRNILIAGCLILFIAIFILLVSYHNKRKSHQLVAREKEYLDNLLHNLVHEFRTPLTLIKGPVDELLKKDTENELLKIVERNSTKMLELVNQVLDFAKIKAGKLEVKNEITNVPLFTQDTLEIFQALAKQKNIKIDLENQMKTAVVGIDSDKFYKILSNLVSNAIKYSTEGGLIKVSVSGNNQVLQLNVTDNGIGIQKNDLNRVFDKFFQVDATTTRKGEGTGLGLAFVKELVELMNGQINLESTYGKGSSFKVTLPVNKLGGQIADEVGNEKQVIVKNEPGVQSRSSDKESILIIEDNLDMQDYLKLLLSSSYEIISAKDGEEGVSMAIENIPNLIISDVMMPIKDGFQVVQEIKADGKTEHIPIILLTAKASFDSKMKGIGFGADDYLSKPFSSDELKLRIANQLKQQRKLWEYYQKGNKPKEKAEHPFVKKAREEIIHSLNEDFNVETFANKMALSRSQLHRKLKSLTGLSTSAFINKVKMDLAYEMLKKNAGNVSEIAYKLSYSDPAYFTKLFKAEFSKSPSEVASK